MSGATQGANWDFTPVFELLRHLNIQSEESDALENPVRAKACQTEPRASQATSPPARLGDFGRVWSFLGENIESTAPVNLLPTDPDIPIQSIEEQECDHLQENKAVRWRDEVDGADLADDDELEPAPNGESLLTKKERKRLARKNRKEARRGASAPAVQDSTASEAEVEREIKRSHDRYKIIQNILGNSEGQNGTSQPTQVLKRPPPLDEAKWPVARPFVSSRSTRAHTEPVQSDFAIAAERKAKLMKILSESFPNERPFLEGLSILSHPGGSGFSTVNGFEGLHVFVDASNVRPRSFIFMPENISLTSLQIMIGFHDAIRALHSIPKTTHMRRQPLSFHNLSLTLTRGRPTSKLVLVGSDNFPAIQEASTIGYETNILERVRKTKVLTDRQRYFANGHHSNGEDAPNGKNHTNGYLSATNGNAIASAGSGSESQQPPKITTVTKSTEQGVDEILHLKMLESIVDCAGTTKPGTMVLASGDAAEAEYSAGFLVMLERALKNGLWVELASFKANTSGAYRRREWRERWGERFRMVELDGFVECLMGVGGA